MAQNGYFFGGSMGQNVPSVGGKGGGKPVPMPGLSRQPFSQGMGVQPAYGMPNQFVSTGHYAGPMGQNVPSANPVNMSALPSQPPRPMLPPESGPRSPMGQNVPFVGGKGGGRPQPWRYQPLANQRASQMANQQQNNPMMQQGLGWLMNEAARRERERPRNIAEQLAQGYSYRPRGMPSYGVGGKGGGMPAPAGGGLVQGPTDPSMAVQSGWYRGR